MLEILDSVFVHHLSFLIIRFLIANYYALLPKRVGVTSPILPDLGSKSIPFSPQNKSKKKESWSTGTLFLCDKPGMRTLGFER